MANDRVMRTLKITTYVIIIVAIVLMFVSMNCASGMLSKKDHFEYTFPTDGMGSDGVMREGFKMNVDHVGGYYQIGFTGCQCGCEGPRFSLSRGAGQYAFMKGQPEETGFYGPAGTNITPQDVDKWCKGCNKAETQICQEANAGLNNIPNCPCGRYQCKCCQYQKCRGPPESYKCGPPHYYGSC